MIKRNKILRKHLDSKRGLDAKFWGTFSSGHVDNVCSALTGQLFRLPLRNLAMAFRKAWFAILTWSSVVEVWVESVLMRMCVFVFVCPPGIKSSLTISCLTHNARKVCPFPCGKYILILCANIQAHVQVNGIHFSCCPSKSLICMYINTYISQISISHS